MPKEKRVHIITHGCAANQADSETMAGVLLNAGYELSEDSSTVIINTCTVKGPTEDRLRHELSHYKKLGKKIVVAGCVPQADRRNKMLKGLSLVGPNDLGKITEVVEGISQGESLVRLGRKLEERVDLPHQRKDPLVEILPISQGCLSSCSFCKTKHARGALQSYEIESLVRRVSRAVDQGVRAVWLTSQDNSAYGADTGQSLITLLSQLLSIDKDFQIRVGMGNPEHYLPILDDLLVLLKDPRLYGFLHIPIQSASNSVLQDMKRDYSESDLHSLFQKLRKADKDLCLATDVICGFPGETEADFEKTLQFMRTYQLDVVHISRFWPRPGTPAARLPPLPVEVSKFRTAETTRVFQSLSSENLQRFVGTDLRVRFFEKGSKEELLGRDQYFRQVVLPAPHELELGESYRVQCTSSDTFHLKVEGVPNH